MDWNGERLGRLSSTWLYLQPIFQDSSVPCSWHACITIACYTVIVNLSYITLSLILFTKLISNRWHWHCRHSPLVAIVRGRSRRLSCRNWSSSRGYCLSTNTSYIGRVLDSVGGTGSHRNPGPIILLSIVVSPGRADWRGNLANCTTSLEIILYRIDSS